MKLNLCILTIATVLLVTLAGCQQAAAAGGGAPVNTPNPNALPSAYSQTILTVDANGHFTQQQIYSYSSASGLETDTFNTDGSCEFDWFSPGAGPLVQTSGVKGTYSWSPTSLVESVTVSASYSSGTWTPVAAGVTQTEGGTVLFTNHSEIFNVYVANGLGGWVNTWNNTSIDSNTTANSHSYSWSDVLAPAQFSEVQTAIFTSGPNSAYTSYSRTVQTIAGSVAVTPANVSFSPGNTVTFQVAETSNSVQNYSSPSDTIGTPSSSQPTLSFLNLTFTDVGGAFLVSSDAALNYSH